MTTMNVLVTHIQHNSKWIALAISFALGLLLVTAIEGQEPVTNGEFLPEFSLELSTDSSDQVVLTQARCRKNKPVCVSGSDEVWLVSARNSHLAPYDLSALEVSRLENSKWIKSDIDELVQRHTIDKTRVTMLYAHGNRTDLGWATSRGLQFYENSLLNTGVDRPPVRFVLFAWKSEAEQLRPLPDFDVKSARSVILGHTFGSLLSQFHDRDMVLCGFSLGAQVVLSGLANPELQYTPNVGRYKVALFAAALDSTHPRSDLTELPYNSIVEQTEVFVNRDDRAVKAAQWINRRRAPSCTTTLRQLAGLGFNVPNRIHINDVTDQVSKRHSIVGYGLAPKTHRGLADLLFSFYTSTPVAQPAVGLAPACMDSLIPAN